MIHINERPKNLPPLATTMCSRRHKGMVQTSLILVLIVCIGYGFYLYNLLQVKVKYLDTKALRHQSQQQSLSSQLQAVYEDRARFQKAIQKSKTEMENVKDEKESQIQSMLIEHQDQNQALDKENKELKEKNKAFSADNQNLKSRHDRIYRDHDELKKKHQNALSEHADSINKVNVELQMYQHENEAMRNLQQDLEYQIQQNKRMHLSLQTLLKEIPVDAINFDHPDIGSLDANDKRLLMDHLREGKVVFELQNEDGPDVAQHNQVAEDLNEAHPYENEAVDRQPKDQPPDMEHRSNPVGPDDHLQVIDICSLPLDHGPCQNAESVRYAYHLGLKECRGFTYGGCGGNQNNFKTPKLCMDVCNDSEKRYIRQQIHEDDKIGINHFQAMADLGNPDNNLGENIHDVQPGNVIQETVRPEENENGDEQNRPQEAADTEQDRLLKEEELKAKEQEEAAKLELEKQKQQTNPDRTEEDHLQKLRENSKLQLELAQDQRSDMEKIIDKQRRDEQQQQQHTENQIEADVEDDNNDGDGERYEDVNKEEEYEDEGNDNDDGNGEDFAIDDRLVEKDDDVQVAVPPAAQVAGHDPEAVMNPPPAKQDGIDSEEINGQNVYREQEQEEEHVGDNDDLAYEDGNQQEEGDAGVDENGNADEAEEEEKDNYNREDAGIGEDDKVDDGGADDYENEEEDSDERKSREFRNHKRVMNDKNFLVRNEVQDMIPLEANLEKEI